MSLQVWLPLNGDLDNQGLSNIIIGDYGNISTNTNGKIGQCYSFDGIDDYLSLDGLNFSNLSGFSIAFWCKPNNTSLINLFQIKTPSAPVSFQFDGDNYFSFRDNTHSTLTSVSFTTPTANVWTHYAFIYNKGDWIIYKNGKKDGNGFKASQITTFYPTSTIFYIASRRVSAGNYYFNGYLNDFRIYDHALSTQEVKKLAQGLILHYPLNDVTHPNLLSNDPNKVSAWAQSGITLTQETDGSLKCVTGNGERRIYNSTSNVWTTVGNVYTVSFVAKASTSGIKIRASRSIADYAPDITLTTDWKYYSTQITITGTSTGGTLSIQGINNGDTFWLRNVKLENGTIATPYLLPGLSNTTVYDISGYKNHGIITGSLTATTNSPRYNIATQKPQYNYIRVSNRPKDFMAKDAITVNLWINFSIWGNPISCTNGGGWNFEELDGGLRFPIYIANVGYKLAQTTITSESLKDSWHMLTGTMNEDNIKIYIDSKEEGSIATESTNGIFYNNNYVFVGAEAGGDSETPESSRFDGKISDVRIYATALSTNEIKELYHLGRI